MELILPLSSVLILAIASLLWELAVHRRQFQNLPKPPHSFLFGHLRLLAKVQKQLPPNPPISVVINQIQAQYQLPDLFYLDLWPFAQSFLVTGDLAVANRFLDDYIRHPIGLKRGLQPLAGGNRGLVSSDSSEWHNTRTMIRSVFSVTNVQRFVPDMAQYSMELREALLHQAETGRPFRMIDPIERWGADLTFRFLLGDDTAVQRGGWGAEANRHVQTAISYSDDPVSWNPWIKRQRRKMRKFHLDSLRQKIRTALDEALQRGKPAAHNKFLSLLDSLAAKYKEEYPDRTSWDSDTLIQHVDTVSTMFLAADVSSMVLTYVYAHIAQDETVAAELRKEHNAVFPGDVQATLKSISENPGKLKELPYTTAVIKESMRLRPPGLSGTIAPKGHSVNFEGTEYSIDGGKHLYTNAFRLQANDKYITNPHNFDPTRWLPQPSAELADSWRPFQRGQHSCMGENMMMPGLVIALVLTMRDIDVALAYGPEDIRLSPEMGGFAYMEGSFASKPAKGLPVTVKALT